MGGRFISPAVRSTLGDVAPAVQWAETKNITKVVCMSRFYQLNVVPDMAFWGRAQH